jgi:cytochrome b
MNHPLENEERRKRREPEMYVWDRVIRSGHWLLAISFAALYLEYKKFPLHPYAGYLVCILLIVRIFWGFAGPGAARFSTFSFSPREMLRYMQSALHGHAEYHFSHNPMGAAMVYALLSILLANSFLGLMAYSASQQLGPFQALIPNDWEDILIEVHSLLGHLSAVLVIGHLLGVIWAARLHRENYALAMLTGIRRTPRAVTIPDGALKPVRRKETNSRLGKLRTWLSYKHPVFGTLILMVGVCLFTYPVIQALLRVNKIVPAY